MNTKSILASVAALGLVMATTACGGEAEELLCHGGDRLGARDARVGAAARARSAMRAFSMPLLVKTNSAKSQQPHFWQI